tara:strand:- start:272 stop:556 length:285 start_codon:yes stop_codon:yes gene_type:complete
MHANGSDPDKDYLLIVCSSGYESSEIIAKVHNGDYELKLDPKFQNGIGLTNVPIESCERLFADDSAVQWTEATFNMHDSMMQADYWELAYELSS